MGILAALDGISDRRRKTLATGRGGRFARLGEKEREEGSTKVIAPDAIAALSSPDGRAEIETTTEREGEGQHSQARGRQPHELGMSETRRKRCKACNGYLFWKSIYDVVTCACCHAPANPRLVIEWIWLKEHDQGPGSAGLNCAQPQVLNLQVS